MIRPTVRRLAGLLLLVSASTLGVSGCVLVPYGGYGGGYYEHEGHGHHDWDRRGGGRWYDGDRR